MGTHPLEKSRADLGSLGVESDGEVGVDPMLLLVHLGSGAAVGHGLGVVLVCPADTEEMLVSAYADIAEVPHGPNNNITPGVNCKHPQLIVDKLKL